MPPETPLDDAIIANTRWTTLDHLRTCTSTNDVAAEHCRATDTANVVVVADAQTAGRGRAGRAWHDSGAGDALLVTFATRPPAGLVSSLIPLAAGLAVLEAVESVGVASDELQIKWPNDVLLRGRKLAGVLCERLKTPDETLLVGIGINVAKAPDAAWSCVADGGGLAERGQILRHVALALDAHLSSSADVIVRAVEQRLAWRGREVHVQTTKEAWSGQLEGLRADGALLVGDPPRPVVAGDVDCGD